MVKILSFIENGMVSQKRKLKRYFCDKKKVFLEIDSSGCWEDSNLWEVAGEGGKQALSWRLYSGPWEAWLAVGLGARFRKLSGEASATGSGTGFYNWQLLLKTGCWDTRSSVQRKGRMPTVGVHYVIGERKQSKTKEVTMEMKDRREDIKIKRCAQNYVLT